jgi:hypothetical protein
MDALLDLADSQGRALPLCAKQRDAYLAPVVGSRSGLRQSDRPGSERAPSGMMSDLWRPYDKSRLGLSGSRASGSDCCIQAAATSEVTEQTCRSTDTSVQRATA